MRIEQRELRVATRARRETINVTELVEEIVREAGVRRGLCLVHVPHATAALVVNEDEEGLRRDVLAWISRAFPDDVVWEQNRVDDTASAHLSSLSLGSSAILPIESGRLVRGTWQELLLIELDGPRTRRIHVTVIGE
ncbi:MAG: secondary thiamine-phosphate synthase enzyme YjbQ [Fervidicoccaceae archaeon]